MASSADDTARTVLFDALGPIEWPRGIDGRALRNRFTDANQEQLLGKASVRCCTFPNYNLDNYHCVKKQKRVLH